VNADGSFTAPAFTVQGTSQNTVSDALRALDTTVTGNTRDIGDLQLSLNSGTTGLVRQDEASGAITVAAASGGRSVSLAGTDGTRTVSGVKDANLATGSSEAVTGSQLFATNAAVKASADAIGVNTADIAANRTAIGANTATIAAQGTTLAQQGGQLRGLATSLGGGAAVNADGSFTAPAFTVQGTSQNTVSDALRALDTTVTGNTRDIGDLQLSLNSGTTGLVRQDEASGAITVAAASGGRSVSLAGTDGARTLSGVKDANLAAGSSEAVTGSQLFQSYTHMNQLAEALGGGSSVDMGDETRRNSGFRFIAPTFTVQGQNKHTVSDALNVLDGAVTDNSNVINGLMSGSHGLVQLGAGGDIITIASNSGGKLLNVAGNAGSRVVTGVANGEVSATSTDAVNGSQLHEINAQVAKNTTDINQLSDSVVGVISGKSGLVQQEKSDAVVEIAHNSGGKTVSVDGTDGNRRISGVSDGISDDDAATVAQLKSIKVEMGSASMVAMNSDTASKPKADGKDAIALGANASAGSTSGVAIGSSASSQGEQSVALGNGSSAKGSQSLALGNGSNATAKNAVALGSDSVASEENTVSVGSSTNQRRITNVARGVNNSDVVTVGQMNDGFASLQNYTNHEINKVNKHIERVENKLTAGIASAMALSGIPQAYQPDSSLLGAAVSSYGNASAIAVGLSHISENGRWITKLQASGNTESDFGGSVGVGFQW
jgi:autotransporter adhesin